MDAAQSTGTAGALESSLEGALDRHEEDDALALRAPVSAQDDVLITGVCGRMGKLLTRHLHRERGVIGIDRRPFPDRPKDVVHHQFDLRRKKTQEVLRSRRVRAVVHLGTMHDMRADPAQRHSWNVVALQKLTQYALRYGVKKLVVLSSANVYGPHPENPQFLSEEAPLLGAQNFSAIRDLMEVDMLAQNFLWKHPEVETVVLRPCHILGRVRNAPSKYLRLRNPVTVWGFDPMVQPIHERDVVSALQLALRPGVRGIYNLRGPGELPLSHVLRLLGRTARPLPAWLAKRALRSLWNSRLGSFPAPEMDHIRFPCMIDDTLARNELGFEPRYDMRATLQSVDSDR